MTGTPLPEPEFCKHCRAKVPVKKCGPIKVVNLTSYVIMCVEHEHYIRSYDVPKYEKDGAGGSQEGMPERNGALTDQSPFPFGRFGPKKGDPRKCGDVPAWYLLEIGDADWIGSWPAVKAYIETNRKQLEAEAGTSK